MTRRVYIETYGCQMNQLDSELILGSLQKAGYNLTRDWNQADVILFNTCSVREHAEDRAYSNAGMTAKLKKKNPNLIVGIVGCMAQNHQEAVWNRLPFIDLIVGPRKFGAIPRLLRDVETDHKRRIAVDDCDDEFTEPNHVTEARHSSFQAYVKVMEGCDMNCTFCIVPKTRGTEISRTPESIVDEIKCLVDQGVVEVTLLGQTVNSYGKGLKPSCDLAGLLEKIHERTAVRRIRFITSHPVFMKKRLIEAMRDLPRVCKYLHVPAQSGSNRILELMKRCYTRERYLELANRLYETVPGIALASDWIVGFPTETEEDFQQTVGLLEQVRFQNSFVFKYSPRPDTEAAGMKDDVPFQVKQARNHRLLEVQAKISLERNKDSIGRTVEVLVEGPSKTDPKKQMGRTDQNQIVCFEAGRDLRGQFVNVTVERVTPLTLFGSMV